MNISVILCTFNRARDLSRALDSLAASVLPSSCEWEVLVVDNNSTDDTKNVVDAYCKEHPGRFRYVFEPTPGKSYALNRGIRESHGELLAFLDDDVRVEPEWLRNLTSPLSDPRWAGVGGRILPEDGFQKPSWLSTDKAYALAPLAVFDPEIPAGKMNDTPFGANMAFPRRAFEKYGNFRCDLGPQPGGAPQKSEDSEFGHRVLKSGESMRYEPSAVVYHIVPPNRLKKKYFLDWWFDKARADVLAFGVPVRWAIAGIPAVMFRRIIVWTARWIFGITPASRFSAKCTVWSLAGSMSECYRQAKRS